MRKLFLTLVLSLTFNTNVNADIKILEEISPSQLSSSAIKGAFSVTRICSDGFEFLVTGKGNYTSVTQVLEERDGKSLPRKC